MNTKKLFAMCMGCTCLGALAHAGETVTYTYDALGRLVGTQAPGASANGTTQIFQFDGAGNRTQYQTLMDVALSMSSQVVNLTSAGATLTVHISNPSAGGTVTFTENGQTLGSVSVAGGQASMIVEGLSQGVQTITASYSGDGTDAAQTTSFTVKVQNLGWLPAVLQLLLQ